MREHEPVQRFRTILGIPFLNEDVNAAVRRLRRGGLMVVPSAPGLATLTRDARYRQAVAGCDFAIVDSAYLATLWFLATGEVVHRTSGLKFLRAFLDEPTAKESGSLFLVNPSDEEGRANVAWLRARGFAVTAEDCYTAPRYRDDVHDAELLALLQERRPRYVMLNVGGGTQEPLGYFLKTHLDYRPAIMCTGAAIAFLTGRQATIPPLVDQLGLGWAARSVQNPKVFVARYAAAFQLWKIVAAYREDLPRLVVRSVSSAPR